MIKNFKLILNFYLCLITILSCEDNGGIECSKLKSNEYNNNGLWYMNQYNQTKEGLYLDSALFFYKKAIFCDSTNLAYLENVNTVYMLKKEYSKVLSNLIFKKRLIGENKPSGLIEIGIVYEEMDSLSKAYDYYVEANKRIDSLLEIRATQELKYMKIMNVYRLYGTDSVNVMAGKMREQSSDDKIILHVLEVIKSMPYREKFIKN